MIAPVGLELSLNPIVKAQIRFKEKESYRLYWKGFVFVSVFIVDCKNGGVSLLVKARGEACQYLSWLNYLYFSVSIFKFLNN
jgi:hypothetical protein